MRPIEVASAIIARRGMKRDLYAEVSARIVAELEAGAAPRVKPWSVRNASRPKAHLKKQGCKSVQLADKRATCERSRPVPQLTGLLSVNSDISHGPRR